MTKNEGGLRIKLKVLMHFISIRLIINFSSFVVISDSPREDVKGYMLILIDCVFMQNITEVA